MTTSKTRRERGRRSDYTPTVRPRAARQEGQRRLTPGYLDDLSDTKFEFVSLSSGSGTTRTTVLTPGAGKRLRIVRVNVYQIAADGLHFLEVYYGTGVNIAADPPKVIDYVRIPDLSQGQTRTWSRGTGPIAAKNEVLSVRFTVSPTTSHKLIVEYTEER
ncbi:MAG: hypothetical protein IIA54_00375 [Chloroflexi bacterium]|nr:hypothetical protein [Chloroflexota bacterium]